MKKTPRVLSLLLLFAFLCLSVFADGPAPIPVPSGAGDPVQDYPLVLKQHQRMFRIPPSRSGGWRQPSSSSGLAYMAIPAAMDVYTLSTIGNFGGLGWSIPLFMAGSLLSSTAALHAMNNMPSYSSLPGMQTQIPQDTLITVTLWDSAMVNAQTLYFATKDVVADASQIESFREGLLSKYPAESEIVFEVGIFNGSLTPLSLSPFSWHFYLLDSAGQRHKPIGYDSILDEPIKPGETVAGKIFFPRVDPVSGIDLQEGGVKGLLEDVNGKTFHFEFNE